MSTTSQIALTGETTTSDSRQVRPEVGRAWALSGVAAGLLGIVSIGTSMSLSENSLQTAGDAEAMVADLATRIPQLLVFHLATAVTALLLVVFAAGLHRRLAVQAPAGSLAPAVAAWGLLLVSVAALLGSGLNTQFIFGLSSPESLVTESAAFYSDWVATIPWLWVGAGLTGVTVAVAALRHGAAPRWIGMVGMVLGGLTLLAGISPFQYLAGFLGPVWLLVTATGFVLGDRR